MIKRLYIHNFRCLENFELSLGGHASTVLIGKNGVGKSTLIAALRVLQKAARGSNRIKDLVSASDLARGNRQVPMRFEISMELGGRAFEYALALELPEDFRELRVREERLSADNKIIYSREVERISISKGSTQREASFVMDWHSIALPVIQGPGPTAQDPVSKVRSWLSQMLLLRPVPQMIEGYSSEATLQPSESLVDIASWFTGIMAHAPSAYIKLNEYLKQVLDDFDELQSRAVSTESRQLRIIFRTDQGRLALDFGALSDGEKCFVAAGLVIAAQAAYGPIFCFWDEPDSYLALSEVGHFILNLRKTFKEQGQFVATSHNPEAIKRFSRENTLVLQRHSHLEPTQVRRATEFKGELVDALLMNELTSWL